MIFSFVKKIAENTLCYKFMAWLHESYLINCKHQYLPEQFRFYGDGVRIGHNVQINRPERVILKDFSLIGHGAIINSKGGLHVGRYSGIGFNCVIWTSEHHYRNAKSIPFDNGSDLKPVIIRDFVWIGSNVKITPGREIGEGSIIGMGTVVVRDVPPFAIVMGNPGEIMGYRDKDHFNKCKENSLFQSPYIGKYEERIFPLYKRRFKKEISELGFSEHP